MSSGAARTTVAVRVGWVALVVGVGATAYAQPATVSFRDAVQRALEQNPNAAQAREEVRRAAALLEQTRASSLPTLYGTGAYTRLDGARPYSSTTFGPDYVSANVTLAVPLVAPKQWGAWAHADDTVDVARASNEDVRRLVALATGKAYLSVFAQRRVVEAAVRARDTAKAHFEFSVARTTGGIGSELDQVRAERELSSDEVLVEGAMAALTAAREALSILVATPEPVEPAADVDLGTALDLAHALEQATAKRSDVQLAKAKVLASNHLVRDDWLDYLPSLVGAVEPVYNNPALLPLNPASGWQATLNLSVPFYDGGLRYGQAHERSALQSEAQIQLDGVVRQARSEVRAAFDALEHAKAAVVASRKAAFQARRALELANIAYRNGASTNIEVIDAEREARDAETAVAISDDTELQARLDLLSVSGAFP